MLRPRTSAPAPARLISRLAPAAAAVAGLGAGTVISSVRYVRSQAGGHLYDLDTVPYAPVGLVFGALAYADGTPSSFLQGRLDLGRDLYARGKIDMLLVSGEDRGPEYDEPTVMRDYLVSQGIPAEVIVRDPAGFDTYDSCVRARDVYGVSAAIMITQTYHLPRTVGTARAVGLEAYGVGDHSVRSRWRAWTKGVVRDQLACVKTVYDLRTGRTPRQDPPSDAVARAVSAGRADRHRSAVRVARPQ